MHLKRIELVGFKTFAQKCALDFENRTGKAERITAVVGPNGSGKSNLADAVRWVLGEQSLKLLRGKESQDVIFSGSEGHARSGFAEVSITINNEERKTHVAYPEIVITRRLYRDGESEYLLNGNAVRLADIHLLLAEANFGQRSYGVIAQGMVDHILVAAPHERKSFFDDAAGVKALQIKRHQANLKLTHSEENLKEAQAILAEIEPRLRALERQVKRLEQRDELERQLKTVQVGYYGGTWHELARHEADVSARLARLAQDISSRKQQVDAANAQFATMEREETTGGDLPKLQAAYQELIREKSKAEHAKFELERKIAVARIRQEKPFVPLPLSKIIGEVEALSSDTGTLLSTLEAANTLEAAKAISGTLRTLHERAKKLLAGLQRPPVEEAPKDDPALLAELSAATLRIAAFGPKLQDAEAALSNYSKIEQQKRGAFFEMQRAVQSHQRALFDLERQHNDLRVELARIETRRDTLTEEMASTLDAAWILDIKAQAANAASGTNLEELRTKMHELKRRLEFIGGIEETVPKEYEETKARYDHLTGQITDLLAAITSTKKILKELDETIKEQSERALAILNREFEKYFKKIFGGGVARILEVKQEVAEEALELLSDEEREEVKKAQGLLGVDIQATPPGKRLKDIRLLSGGERAMTALALIAAIISMNPSPFVVLDEVDAALDEANSRRYAEILKELSERTQFVIITHNRTTMEAASSLFGVTMGADGISKLLSVKLEDVKSFARQ